MAAYELRDARKRYGGGVEALRGVDLAGRPGEVVGLLGPNGAGKTTAIKSLAGLVRLSSGVALLEGRDSRTAAARAALGYMPERAAYPAYRTAVEVLDLEGRLAGLGRRERRARAGVLLERVGVEAAVARRRVRTYSKGERARLGVAVALVGSPRVALFDEPTDGLDPVGRRAVRELLVDLRREGIAVLLNSHLLSEVESTCDRVVVLRAGRVIAAGTRDELLASGEVVYAVRLAAPPGDEALAACAEIAASVEVEGEVLSVALRREGDIDGVVDLLRGRGLSIRDLRPRATLEDAFLRLLSEPGEADR